VRNVKVLQRVKEDRNIPQKMKRRKANWIGHTLLGNSLLKHVFEGSIGGRIEVAGRRERRLRSYCMT
jgi:hypothetical protein